MRMVSTLLQLPMNHAIDMLELSPAVRWTLCANGCRTIEHLHLKQGQVLQVDVSECGDTMSFAHWKSSESCGAGSERPGLCVHVNR